jgi:hypothetical protein
VAMRPLPQAWAMACGVSGAPLVTGKAPTVAVDFGESLVVVSLVPEGV